MVHASLLSNKLAKHDKLYHTFIRGGGGGGGEGGGHHIECGKVASTRMNLSTISKL